MKLSVKNEFYKAFHNKWLFLSLGIGTLLSLLSLAVTASFYYERVGYIPIEMIGTNNKMIEARSVYNNWIGGEGMSLSSSLFFLLLPVLATLPFSWSFDYEKRSGYTNNLLIHETRGQYIVSKYFAVFVSGGTAIVLPLILNFLCTLTVFSAPKPDITYLNYYGIFRGNMFCELFYTHPVLFEALYILLIFLFSGTIATLAMSLSVLGLNRFVALIVPIVFFVLLHSSMEFVSNLPLFAGRAVPEYSPLYFLKPRPTRALASSSVIFVELGILVIFTLVCGFIGRRKLENV